MADPPIPDFRDELGSAGIFLVLRRVRLPLILLIVIFAVSVLGLSLIPGADSEGGADGMGIFEAFYFMSYTATTIGFGEIPTEFTTAQRMWVTFSIFLAVVGWAYSLGTMLALAQDRAFRAALARRGFARAVRRIREPFWLLVGYGNAAKILARSLDDMGRRFVVLDREEPRVASVALHGYRADAPALVGDARDTGQMVLAGLGHPHCEGVIALCGDDEANLDVTMTSALLRPDLPVIARTRSREVGDRMRASHAYEVVNPLDRFGDHLRILIRSPAAYQLMDWLTSVPGTPLPPRVVAPKPGPWVVFGSGPFGEELRRDLVAEGLDVTVIDVNAEPASARSEADEARNEAGGVPGEAQVRRAAAVVVATDNDTTNLWLVDAAHRLNPTGFVVSLQNRRANASLFSAIGVDFGMVPAEVVAHEVQARIASPALMRFLPQVPRQGEEWAAGMVERLVRTCGKGTPDLWLVLLDHEAQGVNDALAGGGLRLGDLLRSPADRDSRLHAVVLAMLRGETRTMAPPDETMLEQGDRLLLAGRLRDRSALQATLTDPATAAYVLEGRHVASGWLWQRLARRDRVEAGGGDGSLRS